MKMTLKEIKWVVAKMDPEDYKRWSALSTEEAAQAVRQAQAMEQRRNQNWPRFPIWSIGKPARRDRIHAPTSPRRLIWTRSTL